MLQRPGFFGLQERIQGLVTIFFSCSFCPTQFNMRNFYSESWIFLRFVRWMLRYFSEFAEVSSEESIKSKWGPLKKLNIHLDKKLKWKSLESRAKKSFFYKTKIEGWELSDCFISQFNFSWLLVKFNSKVLNPSKPYMIFFLFLLTLFFIFFC